MEDTLRENSNISYVSIIRTVLILVLMEDTLRVQSFDTIEEAKVLILVLMEDTLREFRQGSHRSLRYRLNPCFNGRYSQSMKQFDFIDLAAS